MLKVQKRIKNKVGVFDPNSKPIVTGVSGDKVIAYLARDGKGDFYLVNRPYYWSGQAGDYEIFVGRGHEMIRVAITGHTSFRDGSTGILGFSSDGRNCS